MYVIKGVVGIVSYMSDTGQRFAIQDHMIVDANEIGQLGECALKIKRDDVYYCYTCQPRHKVTFVHLQDPRYKLHGTFRHASHVDVKRCGFGGNGGCGGGGTGESEEHFKAKYLLQKHVGRYGFNLERCVDCHRGPLQSTENAEVVIEERVTMDSNQYSFDSVLKRNGKSLVVMEVFHTHKTTQAKEDVIRKHDIAFAEFKSSEIIAKLQNPCKPWVYLHNHRVKMGVCACCKDKRESIKIERQKRYLKLMRDCELAEQRAQEEEEAENKRNREEKRAEKKRIREEKERDEARTQERRQFWESKHQLVKQKLEKKKIAMKRKRAKEQEMQDTLRQKRLKTQTERGMLCSWEQEIMILSTHEDMIAREYQNAKRIVPKFVLWRNLTGK